MADSKSKDDLALWNWFLVFVGVTLPSLAMTPQSNFISVIEGVWGWGVVMVAMVTYELLNDVMSPFQHMRTMHTAWQ